MTDAVRFPYIASMVITVPDQPSKKLSALRQQAQEAFGKYFKHSDPGGMTPNEKLAWRHEHFALQLLMEAAHLRLHAEEEMLALLTAEAHADVG